MIELKNISIGYKSELFKIEDLSLKEGFLYALIGKNGAGKTTFIRTILGELKAITGDYYLLNKPFNSISKKDKLGIFSFVPSKFEGVKNLSVEELIGMGRAPFTNVIGTLTTADKSIVKEILKRLNLTHLKDKSTAEISDGERQIAMIGKALAQEAKIIFLDEPTAFLDYSNRLRTLDLLREIAVERKILILFSTHNLDLATQKVDEILAVTNQKTFKVYKMGVAKETLITEVY